MPVISGQNAFPRLRAASLGAETVGMQSGGFLPRSGRLVLSAFADLSQTRRAARPQLHEWSGRSTLCHSQQIGRDLHCLLPWELQHYGPLPCLGGSIQGILCVTHTHLAGSDQCCRPIKRSTATRRPTLGWTRRDALAGAGVRWLLAAGAIQARAADSTNFQVACMTTPPAELSLGRALQVFTVTGYRHVAWSPRHRES